MPARKSLDLSAIEWRIEPVTLAAEAESLVIADLRFCMEVSNLGGLNDAFDQLKRHEDLIIGGYDIVRGKDAQREFFRHIPWCRLRMRQQQALDKAFRVLKALNGAGPMPEAL